MYLIHLIHDCLSWYGCRCIEYISIFMLTFWTVGVLVYLPFGLSTFQFVDLSACRRFGLLTFWLSTFWFVDVLTSRPNNTDRTIDTFCIFIHAWIPHPIGPKKKNKYCNQKINCFLQSFRPILEISWKSVTPFSLTMLIDAYFPHKKSCIQLVIDNTTNFKQLSIVPFAIYPVKVHKNS